VMVLLISVFCSELFWTSFRGFLKYLQGIIILYAGLDVIRDEWRARWAVFALVGAFFLAALAGLWQDFFGYDFIYLRGPIKYTLTTFRITGPFKHSNDYGTFLIPAFAVSAAFFVDDWRCRRRGWAVFWVALFVLVGYALLRSMSRGAFLATAASLFFFAMFFRFRWIVTGGLVSAIAVLWFVPTRFAERLHNLADFTAGTTPERILLLKTALSMVRESPYFGLGLNTYSHYFPSFKPPDYPGLMYAHNSYIQMAAESGLLGIFCFLLFIAAFFWWFVRTIVTGRSSAFRVIQIGLVAGIFGMMVNGMFESVFQSTQLRTLFWVLMGTAAAFAYNDYFEKEGAGA